MKRSETGKRLLTLPNLLACLIILLGVSLIGYFILFPAWGYFHSDCTDTILWAQAGYDAGGFLMRILHMPACFRLAVNC